MSIFIYKVNETISDSGSESTKFYFDFSSCHPNHPPAFRTELLRLQSTEPLPVPLDCTLEKGDRIINADTLFLLGTIHSKEVEKGKLL